MKSGNRLHDSLTSVATLLMLTWWATAVVPGAQAQDLGASKSRPNVLLICVDDLRPELACFGVDYIRSPNIDRLAEGGLRFTRHYVQAPTCGASRYALLTGKYGPAGNGALFQRAGRIKRGESVDPSMPAWFRQNGYTTVSVGKVSHHPGGRGGPDWNDPAQPELPNGWDRAHAPGGPWQHPRGWMHGLAKGEIRKQAGEMSVFQAVPGDDDLYPDGWSIKTALAEIDRLSEATDKPFFLAVGILRPHLPFGAPEKYLQPYRDIQLPPIPHPEKPTGRTTWHGSGEFMKYNRWGRDPNQDADFAEQVRKHYAACVSYADAQVGKLLTQLKQAGLADNTIVVLWGDHGWHLGEHAVWGKHTLFEESLRSPLLIATPSSNQAGKQCDKIVETIDIFPTLCELTSLPQPEFIDGQSLKPLLAGEDLETGPAISYHGKASTIRTDTYRYIRQPDSQELYDHTTDAGETKNLARSMDELAENLMRVLDSRLKPNRSQ